MCDLSVIQLLKLEAIQQRTTSDIDNSHVRTYIVKLINVALSFLALLLIVISFIVNLLHPFLSTRSVTANQLTKFIMKIKSNTTNNDFYQRPSLEENETNSSSGSCHGSDVTWQEICRTCGSVCSCPHPGS